MEIVTATSMPCSGKAVQIALQNPVRNRTGFGNLVTLLCWRKKVEIVGIEVAEPGINQE